MPASRRRTAGLLAAAGGSYLCLAVALWWHAWSAGASTHTLCACGDPALFLWFFQWPATAVAHLHNPFYSTALFHPGGINLLAQTSALGITVPLIPVTWVFGPVAALNVAATLTPALSALATFVVLRRWVRWNPAAYLGGLLFGFSPFVLASLEFAHFMTAAVMLLPLILAVLDEILFRRRHDPRRAGLLLGLLVCWQFFLSSELLAILAVLVVLSLMGLAGFALVFDRSGLLAAARPAVTGLGVGTVVTVVLLAYPVWFALDGPAHLSGLIWPNIGAMGGFIGSNFVSGASPPGTRFLDGLGGYGGTPLPSAAYLGWGLLGVLVVGSVVWFRDRRLWFFGLFLVACVLFSLAKRKGQWVPARLVDHVPVLENVIERRFMIFGFLAAVVMLSVILDHARAAGPRVVGVGAALGLAAVALVPVALTFAPALPFTMEAVVLPRWYATVAPALVPGRVVLSLPAPWANEASLAWQAVNAMSYDQAGGGGPEGVAAWAGPARNGFAVLFRLSFGFAVPRPAGTPAQLAAVRHAVQDWRVTTVVIAPLGPSSFLAQGYDPTYAAAFMTAALGRLPRIEAGAWVWNGVTRAVPALRTTPAVLKACVALDERHVEASGATQRVARCVMAGG